VTEQEGTTAVAEPRTDTVPAPAKELPWITIVLNDPVNLMSYVEYVFREYFGYSRARAHRLMLEVHERGRSRVSTGTREQMEADVQAMHGYGLWAECRPADTDGEAGGERGGRQ
jgi:ATP-dependent Clp protease adaptor protein ClpS